MKKELFFAVIFLLSCSNNIKKSNLNKNYQVEVVEAEGIAPIVNSDIEGAKKTSLNEAMKNALALVVGVYVSGDTFVSKSILIDDNITSQSQGYIEKYEILKESKDNDFYKTKIRANVRKEDLTLKLKKLENEVEKIGSPIIYINIIDNVSDQNIQGNYASGEIINELRKDGFRIDSSTNNADIIITGKDNSNYNKEKVESFFSYSAILSLEIKNQSEEVIGSVNTSAGGIGINENIASKVAIINTAKKSYEQIKNIILDYYNKKRIVSFKISNINNINEINELIKYFRNIPIIKDAILKNFSSSTANIEILMRKGNSSLLIPIFSKNDSFSIVKTSPFEIETIKNKKDNTKI